MGVVDDKIELCNTEVHNPHRLVEGDATGRTCQRII